MRKKSQEAHVTENLHIFSMVGECLKVPLPENQHVQKHFTPPHSIFKILPDSLGIGVEQPRKIPESLQQQGFQRATFRYNQPIPYWRRK